MSLITYPIATEFKAFCPQNFAAQMRVNQRAHASPFGGSEQVVDMLNDRWAVTMDLPPCTQADAGKREAFFNALRGQVNHTELYHFGRPTPRGTLASSQGLIVDAPQGAASVTIATTPGATLLAGDMIGVDGLLLQCAADCVADGSGVLVVPLVNRLRRAVPGLRRASTATFIDSAGVLQTAAVDVPRLQPRPFPNLITNANNFAAWPPVSISNVVATPGVDGPFGLRDATTLTATSAGGLFQNSATVVSGTQLTGSFWIRRRTGSGQISYRVGDGTALPVTITGAWQRVAVTATVTSTTGRLAILISVAGDAVDVYGAQLEYGAAATAFTMPGLLVEGAATNTLLQSANMPSNWSPNQFDRTPGQVDPFGGSNGALWVATTANAQHFALQQPAVVPGTYRLSIFAKAAGAARICLWNSSTGGGLVGERGAVFNVSTGAVEVTTGPMIPLIEALGNGWFRCSILVTSVAAGTATVGFGAAPAGAASGYISTYAGDGVSGVLVYGAQLEPAAGAPSSYIPTTTTAATRAADIITPVIWDRPTAPFRLASSVAPSYVPGYAEGLSLDFVEKVD